MTLQCAGVRTEPVDRRKGPCPPLSGYSTSIGGEHYNYTVLPYWFICYHSNTWNYIRTLHICSLYCFQYGGPSLELKRGGWSEEGNKHHLQFTVSSNLSCYTKCSVCYWYSVNITPFLLKIVVYILLTLFCGCIPLLFQSICCLYRLCIDF